MDFRFFCDTNYSPLIDLPLRRCLPAGVHRSVIPFIDDRSTCKFIEFSGHSWVLFTMQAAHKTQ